MVELEEIEEEAFDPARIPSAVGDRNGLTAWVEYFAARGLLGGASHLPYRVQLALTGGIARIAARYDKRHTESARRYLTQVLGSGLTEEQLTGHVLQAWRHFFRLALDGVSFERRVPQATLLDHYEIIMAEGVQDALSAGRGGLFLTPHVGDFEAGSALLPHLGCGEIYVVAKPPKNRPLSAHLLSTRERRHIHVLPRRGGMRFAHRILKAGGWIGLLPDQRPSGRAVIAPFFGRDVPCERSAGALLRRMAVPVVVGACYMTERPFHYRMEFTEAIEPDELEGLSMEAIAARINAAVEPLILEAPEQYIWLHDRFRDAPPVEGRT